MISKLRGLWPVRRLAALAVGVWDTFLRDNKVIPPVLAVAALFVFAWIVVGSFIGAPDDEPVSNQNEIAQSEDGDAQPPAPEVENPNTDSYAAYQSKDPFRQLFQTPESTTQENTDAGDGADDTGADDSGGGDSGSEDTSGDSGSGGSQDPDGDNGDGTSQGNPGAADEQYENGQPPRQDPTANGDADDTDDADDTSDTGTGDPQPQTPAQPTRPANPGGGLFDSGGDLDDPNGR